MEFKKVSISELKPAEYNPRKVIRQSDLQPGDPEYERIKASIEEFGYVDPVKMPNIDNFLSDTPKGEPKQKTVVCPHCGGLVPI